MRDSVVYGLKRAEIQVGLPLVWLFEMEMHYFFFHTANLAIFLRFKARRAEKYGFYRLVTSNRRRARLFHIGIRVCIYVDFIVDYLHAGDGRITDGSEDFLSVASLFL